MRWAVGRWFLGILPTTHQLKISSEVRITDRKQQQKNRRQNPKKPKAQTIQSGLSLVSL